jgi:hypothetical protein
MHEFKALRPFVTRRSLKKALSRAGVAGAGRLQFAKT